MTTGPCEGIYYVVREPTGWRLAVQHSETDNDPQHQAMWEEETAPELASQWATVLPMDAGELEEQLKILVFAFLRGRVTKLKDKFVVYHGNDLQPFMKITRAEIENAFGIAGKCRWALDEHEQCIQFEKDELRGLLQLTEDWPATEFWE